MLYNRPPQRPPHKMPNNPKPKLKVLHVPVFRLHYTELERYVKEVFGFEFDYLFAKNLGEGGPSAEYLATGKLEGAWVNRSIELRNGQRTRDVNLIFNVLVQDGYIPAGSYSVTSNKLPDPFDTYKDLMCVHGDPLAPPCLAFKDSHRSDSVFMGKAAKLEKAFAEVRS